MPLTDAKIRNLKPARKQFKLSDSEGLLLIVAPSGGKWWRLRYRFDGKEKMLSLGTYPRVSLAQAREKRNEARKQISSGIDPSQARQALKASRQQGKNTFETLSREWHLRFESTWTPKHAKTIIRRLEANVFPWIGKRSIADITPPELLTVLRRVEARGALHSAHRIRIICGQVFRYAVATGRAERDPTADLRGALPPAQTKHMAAILDPQRLGALLRALYAYEGSCVVRAALKLTPLLFVRPGELRHMEWNEIDFDSALWSIPAHKMKTRSPHLVPLATQSIAILRELCPLTGGGNFVFPSHRGKGRPLSNVALNAALRRMGFEKTEVTPHGFRSTARTLLDEALGFAPHIVEHQLAHAVRDPLGRAYNRTSHLPERRQMMQRWADYLDELKEGANVIPLQKQAGR
jgi:integrase